METIAPPKPPGTATLLSGNGTINYVSSGAFSRLPVTWASRTEEHNGRTSPEELIAAAHAACFSMAFSGQLARNGTPPEQLEVKAASTFDKVDAGWKIARSDLTVRGRVPGIDEARFAELAERGPRRLPGVGAPSRATSSCRSTRRWSS